jgi:hypothetical protein
MTNPPPGDIVKKDRLKRIKNEVEVARGDGTMNMGCLWGLW